MNADRIQTVMGLGEAVLVGIGTYLATVEPGGVDYTSPMFLIGMAVAVSRAVKGYYAAGVKKEGV